MIKILLSEYLVLQILLSDSVLTSDGGWVNLKDKPLANLPFSILSQLESQAVAIAAIIRDH